MFLLDPFLQSLDTEKVRLLQHCNVQSIIMTRILLVIERQNTTAQVAQDMLEDRWVRVDEIRSVAVFVAPFSGEQAREEATFFGQSVGAGGEASIADLEGDDAVVRSR